MDALRAPGRRAHARLFATYAVLSLLPLLALAGLLLAEAHERASTRLQARGTAQAALVSAIVVAPVVSGVDLRHGLTSAQSQRIRSGAGGALADGSLVHLRLRSVEGELRFSDHGPGSSSLRPHDPAFRNALAGGKSIALVASPTDPGRQVIRVVQPVLGDSGRIVGVLEVYLPYEDIAVAVQKEFWRTAFVLAVGLGALYVVLAVLSWFTTLRLRRNAVAHEYQARHDPLTGLPNRTLFREETKRLLAEADRNGGCGAVVLVDLNHFKDVNDTLGHLNGDDLLREVATRLRVALRPEDIVARLGGDEFVLVLPGIGNGAAAMRVLTRARSELTREVLLEGVPLTPDAAFGVAFYPSHSRDVDGLLQLADVAMYTAKAAASVPVVVYDPALDSNSTERLAIQGEFRRALDRGELVLYYQPKIDLLTGRVAGVEALVRWQHPDRGLLPPVAFLPVIEQSALIGPLTYWVLHHALLDCAEWTRAGVDWSVAVNVSVRNLEKDSFREEVLELLAASGVPASKLQLEVTETALTADATLLAASVAQLATDGVTVAIDDFGEGYTNLSLLRLLRVGEVKIDRSFVSRLASSEEDRAVVRAVIDLAHSMGRRVTAEGIDSPEINEWLRDAGCDYAQGFLHARPDLWQSHVGRFDAAEPVGSAAVGPVALSASAQG